MNSQKKSRLDQELVRRGMVTSRSQAENYIRLGEVIVDGRLIKKAGFFVSEANAIVLSAKEQFVSRAGLKLASVASRLGLHFKEKIVLDVGSSTGGFTDYSLTRGAKKVYAVDVGTEQLHPSLRQNPKIELFEKTDIRDFLITQTQQKQYPDIVVMDVSFISVRELLPHIFAELVDEKTQLVIMVKPQFEAGKNQTNKGVIKNDTVRRKILHDFEDWIKSYASVLIKQDSDVAGAKGNRERFYLLKQRAIR